MPAPATSPNLSWAGLTRPPSAPASAGAKSAFPNAGFPPPFTGEVSAHACFPPPPAGEGGREATEGGMSAPLPHTVSPPPFSGSLMHLLLSFEFCLPLAGLKPLHGSGADMQAETGIRGSANSWVGDCGPPPPHAFLPHFFPPPPAGEVSSGAA